MIRSAHCVAIAALMSVTARVDADIYPVASAADVAEAMETAGPGDTLVFANGTYVDQNIEFRGFGNAANPITLRAATPGRAVFAGSSTLGLSGSHLIVEGLRFEGGSLDDGSIIEFRTSSSQLCDECTLRETAIIDYNPADIDTRYFWVSLYGSENIVERCYFENQNHSGVVVTVWGNFTEAESGNGHIIRDNHFYDMPQGNQNGWETIRLGTSAVSHLSSATIIEGNLFERCDGEAEIISSKTGNNIFRNNTFLESQGTLTLRHGFAAHVSGNFFLGNDRDRTGGVRVVGPGHRIWNNYFERIDDRAGGAIGLEAGSANSTNPGEPGNDDAGYQPVDDVVIAHNTIVDCNAPAFHLARGFNGASRTVLPTSVTITSNLVSLPGENVAVASNPNGVSWSANVAFAGLGTADAMGVTIPRRTPVGVAPDGLQRPFTNGDADNGADVVPFVDDDMDGHTRGPDRDIGADEISTDPTQRGPIGPEDVGPSWFPLEDPVNTLDRSQAHVIEAESPDEILDPDGDGTVFLFATAPAASDGEVIESPDGSRTDLPGIHETIAIYALGFVAAGQYTAYLRARGFSGSTDSFYAPAALDQDPTTSESLSSNGQFRWEVGATFTVAAGATHEYRLGRREADAQADAIILYPDANLTDEQLDALLALGSFAPCDIDLNADGVTDGFDIAAFQALVSSGDLGADRTGDGIVDQSDVMSLLDALNLCG
ncbi:MAG: polysaccharide lyase 6 family protein [Planctomycetota bacterium]